MTTDGAVDLRRAIEALRAGVPNRDAVTVLGCGQGEVERQFQAHLEEVATSDLSGPPSPGLVVTGAFGTGKSHLLEYLQHLALGAGFLVGQVPVSKETPLHDPEKVFRAFSRAAVLPGRTGMAIAELAERLQPKSEPYARLEEWAADDQSGLNGRFAASLAILRCEGPATEAGSRVVSFWAGDPLGVGESKRLLKACGEKPARAIASAPARQLAVERFRFIPRLARAAGYAGCALLLDEVELIGRYSPLQRGRSYAELARYLGRARGEVFPGLVTVAALIDNFESQILEQKHDLEYIPVRLRTKGLDEQARWAEAAMRALRRERLCLARLDRSGVRATREQVAHIYARAYDWTPPPADGREYLASTSLRQHIRAWINTWDLQRLFPDYVAETAVHDEEVQTTYAEDADLEAPSEGAEETAEE